MSRIAAKTHEAYLWYLMNTYTELLYYSMEPPFWHIYVKMAAKIIFKLDLPLTVRVSAHCFGVTSPCLCDTFPKFGDLFSHRDHVTLVRYMIFYTSPVFRSLAVCGGNPPVTAGWIPLSIMWHLLDIWYSTGHQYLDHWPFVGGIQHSMLDGFPSLSCDTC